MQGTRSTALQACLRGLLLWSLLLSLSFVPRPAAAVPAGCPTRPVSLSLSGEQLAFCAPTGLAANLAKDESDADASYAQLSQTGGYGVLNIKSLAPGSGPGIGRPTYRGQSAAEYRRQVQDLETQKSGRSVLQGPLASLWGERVPGIQIETALPASTGEMTVRSIEWYVERSGRLWIFMLAWDASLPDASEWDSASQAFSVWAAPLAGPDGAVDLGQSSLRPQSPSPDLSDVGTPTWWSGMCNDGNYFPATGAHSFPLGPAWRGLVPCGPRPYTVSTPDHLVRFFTGAWGAYEFECVELVMRFLYQQWGIAPWGGNGNTIKDSPPPELTFYPNGSHAISPGDILTENASPQNAFGHAAVITAVNLDASGTGTISILEQNAYPSGARSMHVTAWNVDPDAWAHSQTVQGWLHHPVTERVSVSSAGAQASGESGHPSISADGRYVAFDSLAADLVSGDTNEARDVFVYDRVNGQTARVSVASDGTQGSAVSDSPSISADGRYIAFRSDAANLVAGDTNGKSDVFVRDRVSGVTTRVSVASAGSQGGLDSDTPSISTDGRYVAFRSDAANLVTGDTNGKSDIFVHDRVSGETARVSVASVGSQGSGSAGTPSISGDGRYVAFVSAAADLVPGDTNGVPDAFVHDGVTGATSRVSVASDGTQGDSASGSPSISADGRYVVFSSTATSLVAGDTNAKPDVFLRDRIGGETQRVSVTSAGAQAGGGSADPSISADGMTVTFVSASGDLVAGDTNGWADVFTHSLLNGVTARVSTAFDGSQADADAALPSTSEHGHYVAFVSTAANLVDGDSNAAADVFVVDAGVTLLTISGDAGTGGVKLSYAGDTSGVAVSAADGSYSFTVPPGWSGTVTPSKKNYRFRPASRSYTDLTSNQLSQGYTALTLLRVNSAPASDGWVLESSETSRLGGSLDAAGDLLVGDDAMNNQYRSFISFNTAGLPDDAVITSAKLRFRSAGVEGTDPFTTHGLLVLDIRRGSFSSNPALQVQDFQAAASRNLVMSFASNPTGGLYSKAMAPRFLTYINKRGPTQLRLRFALDDNDDLGADYLRFFSGNAFDPAYRPQLTVWYYVP